MLRRVEGEALHLPWLYLLWRYAYSLWLVELAATFALTPNVGQEFCVDLGFVDAGFTLRDAVSCFVRCRMQAVDECSRPNRNPDPDP